MLSKNIKLIILFSAVLFLTCNISFAENNVKNKIDLKSGDTDIKELTDLKNTNSGIKNNVSVSSKSLNSHKIFAAGDSLPSKLSQSSILIGANSVSNYVNKYGKLPNYVDIDDYKFSISEFLYLSSKTIVYKYSGSSSSVTIKYDVKNPTYPNGNSIKKTINKKSYYTLANNVANFITKQGTAPNFASSSFGKIQYQTLVYGFSKILSYTRTYKKLPTYLGLDVKSSSSLNKYLPSYVRPIIQNNSLDNDTNSSENSEYPTKLSQNSIFAASSVIKKYVDDYDKLPDSVTISGKKYSIPEFTYLLSKAIIYKNDKSTSDIVVKFNISNPTSPFGDSIAVTMNKNSYYDLSDKLFSYISKNNQIPNYVSSKYGKIQYQTMVFGLAKIGDYYNKNKKLPSFLGLNVKSYHPMNIYLPYFKKN